MGAHIRTDNKQIALDINRLCKRFPILSEKRHIEVGNLSGGQQQILEICMALMLKPSLILIDEPTLGLSPILMKDVFDIIQEIRMNGATVVLVEQNAKRALEVSDYAFVLELGQIHSKGTTEELSLSDEIISAYLGKR